MAATHRDRQTRHQQAERKDPSHRDSPSSEFIPADGPAPSGVSAEAVDPWAWPVRILRTAS
jgi:hypothetical protein